MRIGIDFGGTKIEIAALDENGSIVLRRRVPNPARYEPALRCVADLVLAAEQDIGKPCSVGIGIPGAIHPHSGLVLNANSTWLNGQAFERDMAAVLGRAVRVENDANCFTLSEASDGAAAGKHVVFGVILGTGCGGAIAVDGRILPGPHRIAGEWGHTPLPYAQAEDLPPKPCFCGRAGCLERYIAGPSLAEDCDGPGHHDASQIPARAANGDAKAASALVRHTDRVARGLAIVINILDPDAIVFGGGLSNMDHLYTEMPQRLARYVLSHPLRTAILRNQHGDSSGVRGAAWLWPASA